MTSFQKLVLSLIDRGNLKLIFRTLRMNVSYVNYVKKCYSMVRLFERAGLCYNESSQRQWRKIDRERIYDGDYACERRSEATQKTEKTIANKTTRCVSTHRRDTISTTEFSHKRG